MAEHATVKLVIKSTRGTKDFTFSLLATIADVIKTAVDAFGFAGGDKFELVLATHAGDPLQPDRNLASYNFPDGTALILTAVGGGV